MKNFNLVLVGSALASVLAGCGSVSAPKFENGQYIPPPAKHALAIKLQQATCDGDTPTRAAGAAGAAVLATVTTAVVGQAYDRFVNWLDEKKANMSASSTGVYTTNLIVPDSSELNRCLILTRGETLVAKFAINQIGSGRYWHMTPHSVEFTKSEAKEDADGEKSLVADIQFSAHGTDGSLTTFFQTTFDLGTHKATKTVLNATSFVGQDSGPYGRPIVPEHDKNITIKVVASLTEHGEGRDWIRGVTNSLREAENREKILKPLLDALLKTHSQALETSDF